MLDQVHANLLSKPPNDPDTYTLGSMGQHNIVMTYLLKRQIDPSQAAAVAEQIVFTFPLIKFSLLVGIGGNVPTKVRLGDVVVGGLPWCWLQRKGVEQWSGFSLTMVRIHSSQTSVATSLSLRPLIRAM